MTKLLLLGLLFSGFWFSITEAWNVLTPDGIHGLLNSCLVIPCSYSYSTQNPPKNPDRVVWYQYNSFGYPLVYDNVNPNSVIEKFRGNTVLYGNTTDGECSLLIKRVGLEHDRVKVYPWIDPENVRSSTFRFYDETTRIHVQTSATKPEIWFDEATSNVIGNVIVECSVYHTCPYSEPQLSLKWPYQRGIDEEYKRKEIVKGLWKVTLRHTTILLEETETVKCEVVHYGGMTAIATALISTKCWMTSPLILPPNPVVFEGVEKELTCSVNYGCFTERPWLFFETQLGTQQFFVSGRNAFIILMKFTPRAADDGRVLTCIAELKGKDEQRSITLQVKRPVSGTCISGPKSGPGFPGLKSGPGFPETVQ